MSLTALAFSPDGRQLATGYFNGDIRIWDVANQKQLAYFVGQRGRISSLAYFSRLQIAGFRVERYHHSRLENSRDALDRSPWTRNRQNSGTNTHMLGT